MLRHMYFGFLLPVAGPFANVENINKMAVEAEASGYDSVWVHDHVLTETRESARYHIVFGSTQAAPGDMVPIFYEPLTILANVAARTKSIKIGTCSLQLPLFNPVMLAKVGATLDEISDGRFIMGVCRGGQNDYYRRNYAAVGLDYKKRGEMFDEYITAIRKIWTEPVASYNGKYVSFSDLEYYPKPKNVKIWVGSTLTPAGAKRATLGDGWISPLCSPDQIDRQRVSILSKLKELGRDTKKFDITTVNHICMAESEEKAVKIAAETVAKRNLNVGYTDGLATLLAKDVYTAVREECLSGNADDLIKRVEAFRNAGISHLMLMWLFQGSDISLIQRNIRTFAKEVIPSFK